MSMMIFFKVFSESMAHYERGLEPENWFEKFHFATLGWKVPFSAAILYAVIVTIWGNYNKAKAAKANEARVKSKKTAVSEHHHTNRFTPFNCFVIAHNIFLTVFSLYCFVCIVKILFESYMNNSFLDAYCDKNLSQYYAGVNYLVWLFYLSKYYELLDTFILLLKGKPSSFLQTFHHSGSILSLWSMFITRIPGMWIFTFLNSFIHTLMYCYFTLTCLGYRPTWKRHLTTMQITQFLVGNVFACAYIVIPGCYNWNHNFRENILQKNIFGNYRDSIIFTFAINFMFVGGLILLFNDFARRTYGKKEEVQHKKEKKEPVPKKDKKKSIKSEETPIAAVVAPAKSTSKKPRAKSVAGRRPKRSSSPVQVATSIIIEPEVVAVKPVSKASRSKSLAASTVRSKSKARAPAAPAASPVRRSGRT